MKALQLIALLLLSCQIQAQQSDKIKIRSIDYGGGIYNYLKSDSSRGLSFNFDFAAIYKKNIVSLNVTAGLGETKTENKNNPFEGYMGMNLLYSREFKVSKVITLEPQTGLGFITQSNIFQSGY